MAKPLQLKDLADDLRSSLQRIADKQSTTIISFVAPHGIRTSPVTFASASIEEDEIYRLETILEEATKGGFTKKLHLIIHTPGGDMHASYKIASFLRSKFKDISAFVPYESASGGTVLCCAANELYISDLGNLTSFDPQIHYKGNRVSVYAFERAVRFIQDEYGERSPVEMPPPWQQMAEKLDPVVYDEMKTALWTSVVCAHRLLMKSKYDESKAFKIAYTLTHNSYTHGLPIFAKEAQALGFNVKKGNRNIMKTYQQLVSCRLKQEYPRHVIDAFYPKLEVKSKQKTKK